MVKNYKCPSCGATLEYDPQSGMMHCEYCGVDYDPEEISRQVRTGAASKVTRQEKNMARNERKIQMNIAVCNSCGAELAMNAVEVSSFCPYCGNASVVMDRVEELRAPDFVIPFKVTKEEAESIIRKKLRSGFFVPKEIKNFETERLRGIYIPFWLYDIYYGAEQKWKYEEKRGKYYSVTRYAITVSDSEYHKLTVDASQALDDNSSRRLEPYDMTKLEPFDPVYLSGFYSDRFDVRTGRSDEIANARVEKMFKDEVTKQVPGGAALDEERIVNEMITHDYAFLPVWFLTFRHEGWPYTIMVNGQTKKMVGAVPVNKKKAVSLMVILALIFGISFAWAGAYFAADIVWPAVTGTEDGTKLGMAVFAFWLSIILLFWVCAKRRHAKLTNSIDLCRSYRHASFVKERQDKT